MAIWDVIAAQTAEKYPGIPLFTKLEIKMPTIRIRWITKAEAKRLKFIAKHSWRKKDSKYKLPNMITYTFIKK